jgi:hypothetical protein
VDAVEEAGRLGSGLLGDRWLDGRPAAAGQHDRSDGDRNCYGEPDLHVATVFLLRWAMTEGEERKH